MSETAKTPKASYYAVIFTSERTDGDNQYAEMADEMLKGIMDLKGSEQVEYGAGKRESPSQ